MSAEAKPAAELAALDACGNGLRARFFWQGDRYAHWIEAVEGHRAQPLLESLEGADLSDCPMSPALHQVNVSWIASDSEQGHVAMLVGAAGGGHWSMCVAVRDRVCRGRETNPTEIRLVYDEIGDIELVFDVAYRATESPRWLGSSYRALSGPVAISERLNLAFVPADGPGCAIVPHGCQLQMDSVSAALPILRCAALDTGATGWPATVRWRYAVRRSSGGPLRVQKRPRQ